MKTLLCDLADGDVHNRAGQPEQRRQHGDENPGVDAVEQNLEDRIERDQTGRVFGRALGDLVPHDHHGDAAGEADKDEAGHVFRLVRQENYRQREHENRANHPVLNERKGQNLRIPEDARQFLEAHLGEGRIHHQDEAQRNRHVGGAKLEGIDEAPHARDERAKRDAGRHCRENPHREIAVEER